MDYSAQRFWHSCDEGFGLFHIVLVLEKRPLAPIVSHNMYLDCTLLLQALVQIVYDLDNNKCM